MHILVRKATPADLETLLRFEQGVVQAERPFDPTLKEGVIHYYDIARMLTSDEVEFVVAISGSTPVGCGFARVEPAKPFLKHARHAYVGLMYVEPEFRGAGVNGRILDTLKQ
jgi:GNAT superfamily N-acetyltransferase